MAPDEYRALRKLLGTQQHVAGLLDIDRRTVAGREAGEDRYPIDREAELAILALVKARRVHQRRVKR
jgi:DNA-binding XRE family transcriptional regulator